MYASLSQPSASQLARTRRYRRCRQMLYAASHPAASVKRAPDTRRSLSAARSILWMTSPSSTRSATSSDGKLRTCGPLAELLSCSSAAAGSFFAVAHTRLSRALAYLNCRSRAHFYFFLALALSPRSGRFSVVNSAVHLKEKCKYAVKVVENKSLTDEENLEALETEVRAAAAAAQRRCSINFALQRLAARACVSAAWRVELLS